MQILILAKDFKNCKTVTNILNLNSSNSFVNQKKEVEKWWIQSPSLKIGIKIKKNNTQQTGKNQMKTFSDPPPLHTQ